MATPNPAAIDPSALEVRITTMRRRHLRGVLRIEQQVYPRPWSVGLFMSELAMRATRTYLVARIGPTVVGYAGALTAGEEGHVTTIAVDPAWHRCGIGARLLSQLTRHLLARGVTAMTLEVRVSNEAAQAMYRRFGFAPAGVRKGYYTDTDEDALVMWLHDVGQPEQLARLRAIEESIPGTTLLDEDD